MKEADARYFFWLLKIKKSGDRDRHPALAARVPITSVAVFTLLPDYPVGSVRTRAEMYS